MRQNAMRVEYYAIAKMSFSIIIILRIIFVAAWRFLRHSRQGIAGAAEGAAVYQNQSPLSPLPAANEIFQKRGKNV